MPSTGRERTRYATAPFDTSMVYQEQTVTKDSFGGEAIGYVTTGRVWMRRGIDTTYVVTESGAAVERTIFEARWAASIRAEDRMVDPHGRVWTIINVEPVGRRRYVVLNVRGGEIIPIPSTDPVPRGRIRWGGETLITWGGGTEIIWRGV